MTVSDREQTDDSGCFPSWLTETVVSEGERTAHYRSK